MGGQEREGKLSGGWGGTMQESEGAFGQVPRYQFLNYMGEGEREAWLGVKWWGCWDQIH